MDSGFIRYSHTSRFVAFHERKYSCGCDYCESYYTRETCQRAMKKNPKPTFLARLKFIIFHCFLWNDVFFLVENIIFVIFYDILTISTPTRYSLRDQEIPRDERKCEWTKRITNPYLTRVSNSLEIYA